MFHVYCGMFARVNAARDIQRKEQCFHFERDFLFTAEALQSSRSRSRQLADTETGEFSWQQGGSGQEADLNRIELLLTYVNVSL